MTVPIALKSKRPKGVKLTSPVLKVDGLVEGPHASLPGHVRIGEAQASHGQEATVL